MMGYNHSDFTNLTASHSGRQNFGQENDGKSCLLLLCTVKAKFPLPFGGPSLIPGNLVSIPQWANKEE